MLFGHIPQNYCNVNGTGLACSYRRDLFQIVYTFCVLFYTCTDTDRGSLCLWNSGFLWAWLWHISWSQAFGKHSSRRGSQCSVLGANWNFYCRPNDNGFYTRAGSAEGMFSVCNVYFLWCFGIWSVALSVKNKVTSISIVFIDAFTCRQWFSPV